MLASRALLQDKSKDQLSLDSLLTSRALQQSLTVLKVIPRSDLPGSDLPRSDLPRSSVQADLVLIQANPV